MPLVLVIAGGSEEGEVWGEGEKRRRGGERRWCNASDSALLRSLTYSFWIVSRSVVVGVVAAADDVPSE